MLPGRRLDRDFRHALGSTRERSGTHVLLALSEQNRYVLGSVMYADRQPIKLRTRDAIRVGVSSSFERPQ